MATPRVFVSSTYYDLKHVRNDVSDFIKSLGYTPVMHDKGGVAYTQTDTLENSCYSELATCDIVVCIIGNHFGTQSSSSNFSITMEEVRTAIRNKKKIYIFIARDVYIENRTYIQNKGGEFKPAYADDIKIHQFIAELCETVKNNPIETFETTADIIASLRSQFAGLFQNFLARDASLTESKTAYDLQETTEEFKGLLTDFQDTTERMLGAFEGTILTTNNTIHYLRTLLRIECFYFTVEDYIALEEFLQCIGFEGDLAGQDEKYYLFKRAHGDMVELLTLNTALFDAENEWKLKRLTPTKVKELVEWKLEESESNDEPVD